MHERGLLQGIFLAPAAGRPLESLEEAELLAGVGLAGDRYALACGTYSSMPGTGRQVTLIEREALSALERDYGLRLEPGASRRNLELGGVALNHLVGSRFRLGGALLFGMRLCEPCNHLGKLTDPRARPGLIHRGGLRADILESGRVRVGDVLERI